MPVKLGTDLSCCVCPWDEDDDDDDTIILDFVGEVIEAIYSFVDGHGCGIPGRHLQVNLSLIGRHSASPQGLASQACPQFPTFTPPKASARIPTYSKSQSLLFQSHSIFIDSPLPLFTINFF